MYLKIHYLRRCKCISSVFAMRIYFPGYIYCLLLSLLPMLLSAQQPVAPSKYEYRAVWLTTIENLDWPRTKAVSPADADVQKNELRATLDSLHLLGVNTVLLQTRVRGDVIYPSAIEPFSAVFTGVEGHGPGYDPLAFAIEECHKRGMQLHAWIVTLPLGKLSHVRKMGRLSLRNRHPELCRVYKNSWYMEPGEPGTADYLASLVGEIVSGYDVDGIHLDYIRYPDRPGRYPDGYLFSRYGKGRSLSDWRRDNITAIVRKIYNEVKRLKPWVRVSCAPLGKHADLTAYSSRGWNARETVYQDAQRWMEQGIMDILFPMIYFSGDNFYPFVRDWQENSHGRHIVPGIGLYRLLETEGDWDTDEILRQMLTSRSVGVAGTVMFRTRHLTGNIKNVADDYQMTYNLPALVPPIAWSGKMPPETPAALRGRREGMLLRLAWNSVDGQPDDPPVKYNVYASTGDSADISNPKNLVSVMLADTVCTLDVSSLSATMWAVTAVDAYGVESEPATWLEKGYKPSMLRDEFVLSDDSVWGMRVVLRDAVGAVLYKGAYRARVGVRGLPPGCYCLEVVDRNGAVLERYPFTR